MDINKIFESEIHVKVLSFFHENQASIETPRGVATWIGEERPKVKAALEDLVGVYFLAHLGFTACSKMTHLNYLWAVLPLGCVVMAVRVLDGAGADEVRP